MLSEATEPSVIIVSALGAQQHDLSVPVQRRPACNAIVAAQEYHVDSVHAEMRKMSYMIFALPAGKARSSLPYDLPYDVLIIGG